MPVLKLQWNLLKIAKELKFCTCLFFFLSYWVEKKKIWNVFFQEWQETS